MLQPHTPAAFHALVVSCSSHKDIFFPSAYQNIVWEWDYRPPVVHWHNDIRTLLATVRPGTFAVDSHLYFIYVKI